MAYSQATYFLDYELGSDAARGAFDGVASNPAGTTVLITSVGHGLVTGAVVVLSAFTAWLNGSWKITWVDADTFTLDTAVWAATADPDGTVTPNGGMSWTDAWKTTTLGATAARIQPGDTIRIAKSPAPSSIGNATWTDLSKTVTLAAAQTLTIDNCETAWTAAVGGDATITRDAVATDAKEGSFCMRIAMDAAPQANILQAYYDTATLDLSAYQKITFWLKNEAAIADADTWKICLCSDNAGATVVDTFLVPAIPSINQWLPLTLTKVGGGNLGNAIESIAIYTGGTVPTASKYIRVDNFTACTTSGLNLQSLISKNSLEQGGLEGWHGIQSINGVTVLLDNEANCKANAGRGYAGTTELVATYKRETIKTAFAAGSATNISATTENGTAASWIVYTGGWNTATTTLDGETFFDGLNGFGTGFHSFFQFIKWNHVSPIRYNTGFTRTLSGGSAQQIALEEIQSCNNHTTAGINNVQNTRIISLYNSNNNGVSGISQTAFSVVADWIGNLNSNLNRGVGGTGGFNLRVDNIRNNVDGLKSVGGYLGICKIRGAVFQGNTRDVRLEHANPLEIRLQNCALNSATPISWNVQEFDQTVYLTDNRTGNSEKHLRQAIATNPATDRVGGTGRMWKIALDATYGYGDRAALEARPMILSVAKVAVNANKAVSISAYIKKDHATNVGAQLVVRGGQIAGIATDVTATASTANTDWNSLALADVTPTEAGVIEVEFWGYFVAGLSNVYIDEISITQAA